MKTERKTVRFPKSLIEEIEKLADRNDLTFSSMVIELCERSLYADFDAHYAPQIATCIQDENYKTQRRIEMLLELYSERTIDRMMIYQKSLMEQVFSYDDDDEYDEY